MELLVLGVLLVTALGVVVFLTHRVFSRDLNRALKRVVQQEQAMQEKADILEQRLTQMEREYQAKVKRGEAEAERLIQDAKSQAMNIRTAAIEEAKHRARQLLLEAEQGKAQLHSEVARTLNGQAVQRACDSLRALLSAEALAALHGTLMHELLEALSRLEAGVLRQGISRVEVVTAQPLAPADSKRLSQWVETSVGAGISVQVATDPALVAGCVVRLGATVVDNTLANRLRER